MSPEQVTGEELDPRSDVYNLGMTMFELRFGWKLMQGGSAEEVMQNHKDGKYTLPLFKDIQEDHYVRIVAESISLRPEDRYQSMDSLIAALEELQKSIRLSKQSKFPRLESIKQAVTSWWESHMNQKLISMTTTDMPCLG
tara:strand:+ start:25 stop:444 length:420 start_codon:yes stop_codon:yes gene_type:complete